MDPSKYFTPLGAGQYTSGGAVLVALVAIVFSLSFLMPKDSIPVINRYPNDWFSSKAHMAFITNADGLIKQGFAKVRERSSSTAYRDKEILTKKPV
jgi:hypothetical protein